jgi:hypothetical protein
MARARESERLRWRRRSPDVRVAIRLRRREALRFREVTDDAIAAHALDVTADVWRHGGSGGWHFVTLPHDVADELRARYADTHGAFGMLAVRATVGSTTWATSLFKDTGSGSYVLPLKADVRRREHIEDGMTVRVRIELGAGA